MSYIQNVSNIRDLEQRPLSEYLGNLNTSYAIIHHAATRFGQRRALTFLPMGNPLADLNQLKIKSIYSYRELLDGVHQTMNLLLSLGVKKGETVSYILPNTIENYFILYAAQAIGVANPMSSLLPLEHLLSVLRAAEPKVLIIPDESVNPTLWCDLPLIRQHCPTLTHLLVVGGKAGSQQQILDFGQLLAEQSTQLSWDVTQIRAENICSYFHTSGTTGIPKLAQHTHLGNAHMAWATGLFAGYDQADTVVLSGLPMFHVGAPMVSGLSPFFYGAEVVVMSPIGWFDPQVIAQFWKIIEKYRGTVTTALPFIYRALTEVPLAGADVRSLRMAISGMAVPRHDFRRFAELTGVKIAHLWGQTEVTSIGTFCPPVDVDDPRFGGMGMRYPFTEAKVVRCDEQGRYLRDCLSGEEGLFCVKGPHIIGYKDPALNQRAFLPGGWFNTRDWVRQQDHGSFEIIGRLEDFIVRGDRIISFLKIEQALTEHPGIAAVAAMGAFIPPYHPEMPVVCVVLKPDVELSAAQLLDWCRNESTLTADEQPIQVMFLSELPRNGMGKPLKYILKAQFLAQMPALETQVSPTVGYA